MVTITIFCWSCDRLFLILGVGYWIWGKLVYSGKDDYLDSELTGEETGKFHGVQEETTVAEKNTINMNARRKIEQLKEEMTLEQQFANDFWEE